MPDDTILSGAPAEGRQTSGGVLAEARRNGCHRAARVALELAHLVIQVYCAGAWLDALLSAAQALAVGARYGWVWIWIPASCLAYLARVLTVASLDRVDLEAWKLSQWQR